MEYLQKIYYEIAFPVEWFKHVTNGNNVTISWNFPIQTDRRIDANKPDIVVKDFKEGTCLLIDMTCPQESNVSRKEFKKLATYKDVQIEVTKMWKLQTTIVLVVIGALGMI